MKIQELEITKIQHNNPIPKPRNAAVQGYLFKAVVASLSCQRYHDARDRYGRQESASLCISSAHGKCLRWNSFWKPLRMPKSPTGSTSGRCK